MFGPVLLFLFQAVLVFSLDALSPASLNLTRSRRPFQAYWNIPTFQCASHKLDFKPLAKKYNIKQNEGDAFRGDVIAILYDPGAFPAILTTRSGSKVVLRNGGVPQEGNLTFHLEVFQQHLEQLVPNKAFPGIGIIDFESWRPVFRQNFGTLTPYKDLSYDIEKQRHPFWSKEMIEKEAKLRFEAAGRAFMEETLLLARKLRPSATWGYYAYPYCFNMNPNKPVMHCTAEITKENDAIDWLFKASTNLHPSLYLGKEKLTPKQRLQLIVGRITEAHRIIGHINMPQDPLILPYYWYNYQDTKEFLSKEDVYHSIHTLRSLNIDGLILWGSSNDVNSKAKCEALYKYIDGVLGPALNS